MRGRRFLLVACAAVALGASFASGFEWRERSYTPPPPIKPHPKQTLRGQVVDDLTDLYYARLPPAVLRQRSVAAILAALHDPYTTYLPPALYRSVMASEDGGFAGVGLTLQSAQRGLMVTRVLPGMPGGMAGIRPGDVITSVNGTSLASLSFARALDLIATGGTRVRVAVVRQGGGDPVQVTLVPRLIPLPVATERRYVYHGHGYEYVRLYSFPTGSAQAVRRLAEQALRDHDRGLILDLRGNPGGLLDQAVGVARVFIGTGSIVTTYGLHEPRQVFSGAGDALHGLRLAVLVDGGTASAAEVVAGSLRHAGAILVGRRTYGKGTVQSIEPLSNGGGLKLTVARFVLPGNVIIEGRGLTPNLVVRASGRLRYEVVLAALRALAAPS